MISDWKIKVKKSQVECRYRNSNNATDVLVIWSPNGWKWNNLESSLPIRVSMNGPLDITDITILEEIAQMPDIAKKAWKDSQ